MKLKEELEAAQSRWRALTFYGRFEHTIILILTGLIAVVIVAAVWNLALKILFGLVLAGTFDPTDHAAFQAVFGMVLTIIIALEFKRSLLITTKRQHTVVHVRTVILIAMLAVVRKLIILDLIATTAMQLLALAAAILALGAVYWLVRDQADIGGPDPEIDSNRHNVHLSRQAGAAVLQSGNAKLGSHKES